MPAPDTFSLVKNPDEVLSYFGAAHIAMARGKNVQFNLSGVTTATPDAIALLAALVQDKKFKRGRNVSGVSPSDAHAEKMFQESGFYGHVNTARFIAATPSNMLIHTLTNSKVENLVARDAASLAVRHVFKDGRKLPPLYEVLIECMANTNNHADLNRRGVYDWWLSVYNDPLLPRSVFTFLDLGVGVFKSLPVQSFLTTLATRLSMHGNIDLIPRLFAGEISSRTGKSERGKGIPRIHVHAKGGTFNAFYMISNDVFVDIVNDKRVTLSTPFQGTLFNFEVRRPPVTQLSLLSKQ